MAELHQFNYYADGQQLDSLWLDGYQLWPEQPPQPPTIKIDSDLHFQNLLAWHYMKQHGLAEGEYTETDHAAWDETHIYNSNGFTELGEAVYQYRATIPHLPFNIDTSEVTDLSFMFSGMEALQTVPPLDTSNAVNMRAMFENCLALTHIGDLDVTNVKNFMGMFRGCDSLPQDGVRLILRRGRKPARSVLTMMADSPQLQPDGLFYRPDGTLL